MSGKTANDIFTLEALLRKKIIFFKFFFAENDRKNIQKSIPEVSWKNIYEKMFFLHFFGATDKNVRKDSQTVKLGFEFFSHSTD